MRKDNPAVYECLRGKDKLHTWRRLGDGRARCSQCQQELSREDADDVFRE